ncbi:hypothetical protein QA612_20275 [Evansella sp. AB-P1]|uniref:hypothetical protein n=1 Tax=Evansella sp. AB-P1 TaxID=3037653 RepID=UPI00241E4698|nr:hypothetical protein [Evansella sp. AB-P1]MDG5789798.1 hypothetical protein [Evansella sp. AB-P1]
MQDNFAQLLGFSLNALAVIGFVLYLFFVPEVNLFYAIISLLGGLVTGTVLITLGKILAVLESMKNQKPNDTTN